MILYNYRKFNEFEREEGGDNMANNNITYDYSKLKGLIVEKFRTRANFAEAVGLSKESVSAKLNNKQEWKQSQIKRSCDLLSIADENVADYFFSMISSK